MAATFCCGGECQILAVGAAPGAGILRHWDAFLGTAPTIVTGRDGVGKAYRYNLAGTQGLLQRNLASTPTSYAARFAVKFDSLPTANCNIAILFPVGGSNCVLRFRTGTNDLIPAIATTTTGATGFVVSAGIWYIVTFKADVSGTTRTASAQIKIAGAASYTDCGTASAAATASTIGSFRVGGNVLVADTPTVDATFDDILVDDATANYPIAEGFVRGLFPTSDGTHSFDAVADFKYNDTTNMPSTSPTDTYTYIDDPLDNITDFLAISGAAAGEYLEWLMSGMPGVTVVNGLEVVSSHHSASTAANKQTLRMVDGGSTSDVISDGDQSQTTIVYSSKHYATKPSAGAWTQATINALKFRWTSSFGTADISPVPYIDGLLLEVDYAPSAQPQRFRARMIYG